MILAGRSDRFGQLLAALGTATGLVLLAFFAAETFGLRLNLSPSLPLGIYIITAEPTDIVEFCPPEPFGSFAKRRGYRSAGACPDGATPLMKPVAARGGDLVEFSARGIAVNGKLLPNTAPRHTDASGRSLQHWPFGIYIVAPQKVWLASTYNQGSYDSRYFGPVQIHSIRNHLRPLQIQWTPVASNPHNASDLLTGKLAGEQK